MSSHSVNSNTAFRFRWNQEPHQHGTKFVDDGDQYNDCEEIGKSVNEIINKNPDKIFFAFEHDQNSSC